MRTMISALLRASMATTILGLLLAGAQSGSSALPPTETAQGETWQPSPNSPPSTKRLIDPREHHDNRAVAFQTPFGQLEWSAIRDRIVFNDGVYTVDVNGLSLELTLDPKLQRDVQATLAAERFVGAGIVMLDARTGAITAIGERRPDFDSPMKNLSDEVTQARAPAASLMKIVTAAAAIEDGGMDPDSEIAFRGGCQYLRNRNWLSLPSADRSRFTLAKAFATSCNTAFARLAIYRTGLMGLRDFAQRFYLNRPIPSDLVLDTSVAALPELETATTFDVGEAGAGFGFSKLTPVHAALLSAAVANGGKMMAPHLVRRARDRQGKIVYEASPREIGAPLTPTSATKMMVLMKATVLQGTSRSHFMRRNTRKFRAEVGGKTGTLRDLEDRKTLYTWFSGVGGIGNEERELALGVLVASPVNWLVRASSLASNSLGRYYALRPAINMRDNAQDSEGRQN